MRVSGWKWPISFVPRLEGSVLEVCTKAERCFKPDTNRFCYLGICFFHVHVAQSNLQNSENLPCYSFPKTTGRKLAKLMKYSSRTNRNAHPQFQLLLILKIDQFFFCDVSFFVHFSFLWYMQKFFSSLAREFFDKSSDYKLERLMDCDFSSVLFRFSSVK